MPNVLPVSKENATLVVACSTSLAMCIRAMAGLYEIAAAKRLLKCGVDIMVSAMKSGDGLSDTTKNVFKELEVVLDNGKMSEAANKELVAVYGHYGPDLNEYVTCNVVRILAGYVAMFEKSAMPIQRRLLLDVSLDFADMYKDNASCKQTFAELEKYKATAAKGLN